MSLCNSLWEKKSNWFYNLLWHIFGCRTPKVSVEICTVSRLVANDWCKKAGTTRSEDFNEGTQPTKECDVHKEPNYVTVNICKVSDEIAQKYCLFTEEREYPENELPIKYCSKHPIIEFDEPTPELCGGFLGIHLDFLANAWDVSTREATMQRIFDFLLYAASIGIREVDYFWWLSSGQKWHPHLNRKIPWLFSQEDDAFNLLLHNEKFFLLHQKFLKLVKLAEIKPRPHLVMAQAYSKYPFTRNIQGTNGLWDHKNWPYIGEVADRLCSDMTEILGKGNFMVKIANEPAHKGSSQRWHDIMYFHEYIYEEHLSKWMDLKDVVCDRTACEGTSDELIEVRNCEKPQACDRGDKHGKDKYGRKKLGVNSVWAELHSVETVEDLKQTDALAWTGSNWAKYILHGDGGSATKTGQGSKWGNLTFASPQQAHDMAKYLMEICLKKKKTFHYCWFPIETLTEDTSQVIHEYYHVDLKDIHGNSIWDKPKAIIRGIREAKEVEG